MKSTATLRVLLLGSLLAGCSDAANDDDPASGGSTDDGATASVESTTGVEPASTTRPPDPTEGGADSSSSGEPPPGTNECDVWAQDCPDGEKCVPWADDGGNVWNALRCAPVNGDGQPGDTCTLEGEITGIDDCALGSICMRLDDGTDNGVCVPQCEGSAETPTCDDGRTCIITNDGVLTLCMEECDPTILDCPSGLGCYPQWGDGTYVCWPDFSGEMGAYGDACMFSNACDPGLLCFDPAQVPGCTSAACCTEYCDLNDPDPDAQCSGQAEGQICQPLDLGGGTIPGLEHVGACAVPT